ncbi:MAG: 23S rRNA (adenine(2503)-C(2))-methyltransferase [Anaerolineae bacterium UTCFX2]|jgi:23S rRNA (adenine2503-C2)-methyltransferase|nr:23S rRNA (adenine(2503)-C(2))-methyltransferase RlmN [Anaerolineae bacterium]MCZ7553879.1 23S rRNA (adenine(2503)-C(2))-methyltransferase RlmN [Anaerolineales bacterium]OQY90862.1 MAG: 23S rRNA (adenine(2503)-C(2))-methyltransferase [Anaerolineae bacterium UTCFX2]
MSGAPRFIFDLDFAQIAEWVASIGEPSFRAAQIWQGLYKHFYRAPEDFSTLPRPLRLRLAEEFRFSRLAPSKTLESTDGETLKTLFALEPPNSIEAVLMRYRERRTICISSQAGCAMGCVFCATGQMGFRRNLTSGEIVEQVIYYARMLASSSEKLSNIVIMGMGEPLHNYEATMSAIDRLNDPQSLNFGARRFTISTVGLVPQIRRFTSEKRQVNLAVSLHSVDDDQRSALLPINRKYPLEALRSACVDYVEATHRRITFEWALIDGVNDSPFHAKKLAWFLEPFLKEHAALCHVNVIPLNPTQKYAGKASSRQKAYQFKAALEEQRVPCTVRVRRGIDIQAGCGQLATG